MPGWKIGSGLFERITLSVSSLTVADQILLSFCLIDTNHIEARKMAAPRDKCDDQLCDYGKSKSVSCFSILVISSRSKIRLKTS